MSDVLRDAASTAPTAYDEVYRPQYHFTPAANWMNDPNGLVVHAGEWHLFYQYNPFGDQWGHMSWGHAASLDLVHWRHLPVAIPEAGGVMAYSGSAVVDGANTSGLGAAGRPPLVALYTGHEDGEERREAQRLAYSVDGGSTWDQYATNPVLDVGAADFRDPKVFWHAPTARWVMVAALAAERRIALYASADLTAWTPLSEFGPAGATGGLWECPDLFELSVDGDARTTRWVLGVNINPGAVAGGSGGQYFVGQFDGTTFTPDPNASDGAAGVRWMDYGKDFYAAVSWSDVPAADGRRIWIGWMSNWQYAADLPTAPWRGAMSLPRSLALRTVGGAVHLTQEPVAELRRLRGDGQTLGPRAIGPGAVPLAGAGIAGDALEIEAEFEVGTAAEVGLTVLGGPGGATLVGYDAVRGEVFVDRRAGSGPVVHPEFPGRHGGPARAVDGRVRLRVFVDRSSVELFANDGETTVTDLVFPAPGSRAVALYAARGRARLVRLEVWPLRSAWRLGV